MHTDENKAIRYLMREMDPSEEMEFEKLIREDEDLLIEVESLRATKRKLSALPRKNPPEHLTNKVAYSAKQLQSKKINKAKTISFVVKRGIAAALLVSAFSGGYYYYNTGVADSAARETTPKERVAPWVDRNEILKFPENQSASIPAGMEVEFNKSFQKLQLVNDPAVTKSGNSGIMLTGSPN